MIKLILDNYLQFTVILIASGYCIRMISQATDGGFVYLKDLLNAVIREIRSKVAARRAGAINLTMLFISGAIAIAASVPSLVSQLGISDNENGNAAYVGPIFFVIVCLISSHFCLSVEKQIHPFKRSKKEEVKPKKEKNK